MRNPLITVLLPCYNSDSFIEETIESILNQTYVNFELIILDDGSTDNTILKINQFSDSRIKVYTDAINRGIVFQLNKGIDLANGDFIARIDSDDVMVDNRLELQLNYFLDPRNKFIEILGTDALEFGDSTKSIVFKNNKPNQISFLLNFYCPLLHPTIMMKSNIFSNGLRYPDAYPFAEDFALWRIANNGRNIAILNLKLTKYRVHSNQTNKADARRVLQKSSFELALMQINNSNKLFIFDNYFISGNLFIAKKSADYVFDGISNIQINILYRFYIRLRIKWLRINSGIINFIIQK